MLNLSLLGQSLTLPIFELFLGLIKEFFQIRDLLFGFFLSFVLFVDCFFLFQQCLVMYFSLFFQFLSDSFNHCFNAVLLAVLECWVLFNNFSQKGLYFDEFVLFQTHAVEVHIEQLKYAKLVKRDRLAEFAYQCLFYLRLRQTVLITIARAFDNRL